MDSCLLFVNKVDTLIPFIGTLWIFSDWSTPLELIYIVDLFMSAMHHRVFSEGHMLSIYKLMFPFLMLFESSDITHTRTL